jgi:hypothetical protein
VVEADPRTCEKAIAFAIIHGDMVTENLGYTIGTAGMERRSLIL